MFADDVMVIALGVTVRGEKVTVGCIHLFRLPGWARAHVGDAQEGAGQTEARARSP
jgi:hypothetical protein